MGDNSTAREQLIQLHDELCSKYTSATNEEEQELYNNIALIEVLLLSGGEDEHN